MGQEIMKDTAASGSDYSIEEKVEIVISPPYKKLAEFNVDLSKEYSSISMVLCGNVKEKKIESSTKEEAPLILSKEIETRNRHFKLHQAAMKGDWNTAEEIYNDHKDDIIATLSKEGDTALHIATSAKHIGFVKKLLEHMKTEDLAIKNNASNTAFFLAAASGEVEIAKAMMKKNGDLAKDRGDNDMLPLLKAALMGNREMVEYLYDVTEDELLDHFNDRIELLVSLIKRRFYDVALDLVERHPEIATARDNKNKETVLHYLSLLPVSIRTLDVRVLSIYKRAAVYLYNECKRRRQLMTDREELRRNGLGLRDRMNKREQQWWNGLSMRVRLHKATSRMVFAGEETPYLIYELLKRLWKQVMLLEESQILNIIRKPWPLLFEAAKQGNRQFLDIILEAYPDLIFEVDKNHYTIFHYAVMYRHFSILELIYDVGPFKDLIVRNTDEEGNNILHLAAKLPPQDRPLIESRGVAFELQAELKWFKKVKRTLYTLDHEATNKKGKTARALFTEQHQHLQDEAEKWIKDIANACIMGATIVATVVFAAAFTVPGGTKEETGTPHFVRSVSFMVFAISDAIALLLSSLSILKFLCVISSRYEESQFISRLTSDLVWALNSFFLSVVAIIVMFCATMFIVFQDGMLWIPVLVLIMAFFASFIFLEKFLTVAGDVINYTVK